MRYGHTSVRCGSIASFLSLPSSLLSLIALLPMSAVAQSSSTMTSSQASETTLSTPISHSRTAPTRSMTTSFISSTTSNSTISSATSTSTPITYDILPGSGHTGDPNEGVFHYYWLILAIFGVIVVVFLWWINRRRRKRKEQMRLSGQNALARDMEGWVNTRRWFHGAWRPNQTRAFVRREEGLNEHGEAPPPYQPKGDATAAQDPPAGLSVPLRTLSREQVDAGRPPKYRETLSPDGEDTIRPDTTDLHITRPETTGSPRRYSTRNLIQGQDE